MPTVTFIDSEGQIKKVETESGKTLLSIALDANVPMEYACGGNGFCTTCMCDIVDGNENLSPRNDREENMGVIDEPKRLGCQTQVSGDVTVQLLDM